MNAWTIALKNLERVVPTGTHVCRLCNTRYTPCAKGANQSMYCSDRCRNKMKNIMAKERERAARTRA